MGVIVDTGVLVSGERRKDSVSEIFAQLRATHGNARVGLPAVTVVELAHGIERASLEVRRAARQSFLNDLLAGIKIYSLSAEIA